MFILFNQMFCSRTNVLSKARDCSDPPGPRGSPQAVASFGSSLVPSLFNSQIFPLEFETKLKAFSTLQPKEFEIPGEV